VGDPKACLRGRGRQQRCARAWARRCTK
jgi:hypothetical protein